MRFGDGVYPRPGSGVQRRRREGSRAHGGTTRKPTGRTGNGHRCRDPRVRARDAASSGGP